MRLWILALTEGEGGVWGVWHIFGHGRYIHAGFGLDWIGVRYLEILVHIRSGLGKAQGWGVVVVVVVVVVGCMVTSLLWWRCCRERKREGGRCVVLFDRVGKVLGKRGDERRNRGREGADRAISMACDKKKEET